MQFWIHILFLLLICGSLAQSFVKLFETEKLIKLLIEVNFISVNELLNLLELASNIENVPAPRLFILIVLYFPL